MKIGTIETLLLCGAILSTALLSGTSYAEETRAEGRIILEKDDRVKVADTTKAP
ncbi:hypothetical protein [Candidatus Enterococcus mansonii]|uniref:Uncharacterized protein n=1 Tax=Candidatus Enterococcus mansonii TaxID=1834181 RepID=A0A242C6Q4_9ENTE|nr:hypothetical protein [Enterococcus sp. 4G2_DIV0659]OTO05590.1 hypothetical protein A5880_002763 [Enterococcus sp. 4G2_DIV0659]